MKNVHSKIFGLPRETDTLLDKDVVTIKVDCPSCYPCVGGNPGGK